jgi:subtilase family serine protease
MKRCFDRLPRAAAAAACALALLLSQATGRAAERQTLNCHVPKAVASLQAIDHLASTNHLKLAINLPLRDGAGLTNLLRQIYDPASPSFHHYLTPAQFAASFGPAEADYAAVIAFAQSNNLTVTHQHPNRAVLDVEGSAADIERTFGVKLNVYQHPTQNRKFYAPDREPSVNLSTALLHIDGLDNFVIAKPLIRHKAFAPGAPNAGTGSGPFGNYWGRDFRNAYVPGTSLTGAGQNIALMELDGYDTSDVTSYLQSSGLPPVPLKNILIDGFNGIPFTTDGDGEVTLDIDMDIAMAPGASLIMVYEATNGFTAPITDTLNQMDLCGPCKTSSALMIRTLRWWEGRL